MGKRNRKGKTSPPADGTQEMGTAATAAPVKPSEALSSVLNESVPSASLDLIRVNAPFCYPAAARSGESCYVVLKVDVQDIGGLNKHMKHDPDKGQFIEYVNSGSIEIHVSGEDLAAGQFYIIPSNKTVNSILEFAFLAESSRFAKFQVTLVHADANGDMEFEPLENAYVDFQWVRDVAAGRVGIAEAVRRVQTGSDTDSENDAVPVETVESPVTMPAPDVSDDANAFIGGFVSDFANPEPKPVSESEPYSGVPDEPEPEPEPDGQPVVDSMPASEPYPSEPEERSVDYIDPMYSGGGLVECPNCHNMMDPSAPCPMCGFVIEEERSFSDDNDDSEDDEVTDEEVQAACERLFHAGGLDLEITAQPFDIQFMQKNPFVPISEDRADGWLNGYVTQMVKNANSELLKLHKQNLFKARTQYLALMTESCSKIAKQVDMDSPDTPYYTVQRNLTEQAQKRRSEIDEEVGRRREDMQKAWDDELKQIMESAAAAARRTYLDKHSNDHEARLRDVEISLLDNIEIEYQRDMADLNEKRRAEAKKQLDLYTSETLLAMGKAYDAMLAEEDKAREDFLAAIQEYIDTHRKEEVARVEVQAEAQRQQDEAVKTAEEYERRIRTISAEHDATCNKYLQEIAAARAHEESIKTDYNTRLQAAEDREKELQHQYTALMDRYESLDASKSKEYEGRLTTLINDKKAAEEHLAHVDRVHNRYNKVSLVIWAAITAAALCIGLLIGSLFINQPTVTPNGNYFVTFKASPDGVAGIESDIEVNVEAVDEDVGGDTGENVVEDVDENGMENADDVEDFQDANDEAVGGLQDESDAAVTTTTSTSVSRSASNSASASTANSASTSASTSAPVSTPTSVVTSTPTPKSTSTPIPATTSASTSTPTTTSKPTSTPTPAATSTPTPTTTPAATPTPTPTSTSTPKPTSTPDDTVMPPGTVTDGSITGSPGAGFLS